MTSASPLVVVTGARRGIGAGIAVEFAARGFKVAITDIDDEGADEVIEAVKRQGKVAKFFQSDLGDVESHREVVHRIQQWGGPITCLVNNAGVPSQSRGDLLNVSPKSFDKVVDVNLRGTFFFTQAVVRHMLESITDFARSIVTVSSLNAEMPHVYRTEYCISMSGLGMLTRLFARRLEPLGIGVFEVRPGAAKAPINTPGWQKQQERVSTDLVLAGRWDLASNVANAVVTLAEGKLGFSTGSVVQVDGGLSLQKL